MAKQKDGRYRTKITIGHYSDGTPRFKYASGRTKKELEEHKEELRRKYITGAVDSRRDIQFSVYALEWYETYKEPNLSPSTRQGYRSALNNRILPVFGERQLRAITAPELQRFMTGLAGNSNTILTYSKSILQNVFREAYVNGLIDRNPAQGLKKPPHTADHRRALTPAEARAVLKVASEHPDGLLLLLLYYTGARRGEVLGLQWRDIDFDARTISINRDIDFATNKVGELKTAYSRRTVPMPQELQNALDPLRGFGETFVLQSPKTHGHIVHSTFVRTWKRLMRAVYEADPAIEAIDGRSILTPHYFRHNYASLLYNAGVDVLAAQKFLGHADIKTTLSIYSHLSEGKENESADRVRAIFSSQP